MTTMTVFTLIGGIYAGLFLAKLGLSFVTATLPFRLVGTWILKLWTGRKGRRTKDELPTE